MSGWISRRSTDETGKDKCLLMKSIYDDLGQLEKKSKKKMIMNQKCHRRTGVGGDQRLDDENDEMPENLFVYDFVILTVFIKR